MRKGSLTVFYSMLILTIMSLLFTMAECIRLYALKDTCTLISQEAIESSFSEYNPYLWEKYGILAVDISNEFEVRNFGFAEDIAGANTDWIKATPVDVWFDTYQLVTDANGAPIINQGAQYAMDNLAADMLEKLKNDAAEFADGQELDVDNLIENAEASLEAAKNEQGANQQTQSPPNIGNYDDPIDTYKDFKKMLAKGILAQVIADTNGLSDESIDLQARVSSRTLRTGIQPDVTEVDITTKLLYVQYLMETYQRYGVDKGHDGLKYEAEYVLCGKESDKENLASTVEKLLLLREAENYIAIMGDSGKVAQAASLATAIGGVSLNPAVIEALKFAIIGVWAYIESILDLRLLLDGGKVPVVKTKEQWTSDVMHLAGVFSTDFKAKDSTAGLSYEDYLRILLTAEGEKKLGLRSCDVIENALNTQPDYESCRLDTMICEASLCTKYHADSMFFSYVSVSGVGRDFYEFTQKTSIAY